MYGKHMSPLARVTCKLERVKVKHGAVLTFRNMKRQGGLSRGSTKVEQFISGKPLLSIIRFNLIRTQRQQ